MRVATMYVVALFLLSALLALPQMCGATYVDGVYWVKDNDVHVNATVHNDEPGDIWRIGTVWIDPPGTEAWAPPGYELDQRWFPWEMMWLTADPFGGGIDPGASLSGFHWATPATQFPGEYWYKVDRYGPNSGYFTPVLIPEPGLGFSVASIVLGLYAFRRRVR